MILADFNIDLPWPVTVQWLLGLFGALVIGTLVLTFANQAKKFFGRRPPVDDTLNELEKDIARVEAHSANARKGIYKEIASVEKGLGQQIVTLKNELKQEIEDQTAEINTAGQRRHDAINEKFEEIAGWLARLDERTKNK